MATEKPKPVKQLQDILKDQQEPFVLEIYLMERGYQRKRLNSDTIFSRCPENSRKSPSISVNCGLNKNPMGIPRCAKVLKAVYNRVISINKKLKIKSSNRKDGPDGETDVTQTGRNHQQAAEMERFSSASSTTVFNSCSESDVEETSTSSQKDHISLSSKLCNSMGGEVALDKKFQWPCVEEGKQLSPVSVLEEIPSHGAFPPHNNKTEGFGTTKAKNPSKPCFSFPRKLTDSSILSASLWKILCYSAMEKSNCTGVTEVQEPLQSNLSLNHFKPKIILEQTRQLMFDCAEEVARSTQGRRKQQVHCKELLGSEELGKFICEKTQSWGKQSGDESNFIKLLDSDLLDSAHEWRDFETQRRGIASEIGDTIWKEITDEIAMDMINFYSQFTRF